MTKPSLKKNVSTRTKELPIVFGSNGVKLKGKVLFPYGSNVSLPVPGAVLCHGFAADYRAVETSARILTKRGIATLIFDFRGHGFSEGVVDGKMVEDVVDAWNFLSEFPGVDKKRIGLIGHSLGAMSAIMAAEKVDDIQALVTLACPPETGDELFNDEFCNFKTWGRENGVSEHPKHGAFPWLTGLAALVLRIWMHFFDYRVRVNWQKFFGALPELKMSEVLRNLQDCAKLFVFCEGDKVTPYQKSMLAYEAACAPKEMLLAKGGFHTTPLLPGNLRHQWINWAVATLMGERDIGRQG